MSVEQVFAEWAEQSAILRKRGHVSEAKLIEDLKGDLKKELFQFMKWHNEDDAAMMSAHGPAWFRGRFNQWERAGLAEVRSGKRYYRLCVIPRRELESTAYQAGRNAA